MSQREDLRDVLIGCWAQIDLDHPRCKELKRELTLENPEFRAARFAGRSTRGIAPHLELFLESDGRFYLPRAVGARLIDEGDRLIDVTTTGEGIARIGTRIELRDDQKAFVDQLELALESSYGAIGQAPPGFGKTVVTLELVARLGLKAIVLVHKEFLMTQWIERIKSFLDLPEHMIGVVQQDRCEWEGRSIVLAMAQSLLARDYGREFTDSFGLVVVDEVHRFAAPTFHKTIQLFPARRRLGVTATPVRKDGLEGVFHAHIGPIAAAVEGGELVPQVILKSTPLEASAETMRAITRRGQEDLVLLDGYLVDHQARNDMIVDLLLRAAGTDRKVLLLSSRREHLSTLMRMLEEACREQGRALSAAYYIGGLSAEQRKASEGAQILLGTYAMAKEGLDIPELDTLFLATPRAEVLQAVGRILRPTPDKQRPVVIDLVDAEIGIGARLASKRKREYQRLGWL